MAMSDDSEILKEISNKLSQLIVLIKLSNSNLIKTVKDEIRKDSVAQAALDLADGFLTASQIKEKVALQTHVSEKTVERRLIELVEKGVLVASRKGKEIYYSNSGLYD
jgi:Fic family protein